MSSTQSSAEVANAVGPKKKPEPADNNDESHNAKTNRLIVHAILRHYWQLKMPVTEALAKVQQTEGKDALSLVEASRCFRHFAKGRFNLVLEDEQPGVGAEEHEVDGDGKQQRTSLPTENWVEVFSFLNASSFVHLEWVSHHWRSILDTHLWPKVRRLNAHVLTAYQLHSLAMRLGPQIRSLHFGRCVDDVDLPIAAIVRHLPRLESFQLSQTTKAQDLDAVAEYVPNLCHAELHLTSKNYYDLPALLHGCQQLQSLELSFLESNDSMPWEFSKREVDLILGLKRMPPRLQVLKAYDCGGVLLAHLTQLCRQQLRVLVTSVFMHENDFSNLAATVTQMPNLRFVQTGIDLSILKFTMMLETEWLERLLGFYTFYFDYEFLSLVRQSCDRRLQHLGLGKPYRGTGRRTYRALAHTARLLPQLRSLDVVDTARYSHSWRLQCCQHLIRFGGSKTLEFLNLMVDLPFEWFLQLVKKCPKLVGLNCFTILDFSLPDLLEVLRTHRKELAVDLDSPSPPSPVQQLRIAICNHLDFEVVFSGLDCPPAIQFHRYALSNPVEAELKEVDHNFNKGNVDGEGRQTEAGPS